MTLNITPIVCVDPSGDTDSLDILNDIEEALLCAWMHSVSFEPGSMLVFKGAALLQWLQQAQLNPAWAVFVEPEQVYCLGIDAFETEV